MRFERLSIQAGGSLFTLTLHPRLTVIAGVGPVERDAIVSELLGALGPDGDGVHLEVVEDGGRRLAIVRPRHGRHRVADIATSADVTDEFRCGDGLIDVLGAHGLDVPTASRSIRLEQRDLHESARTRGIIRRLGELDQTALWSAATRARMSAEPGPAVAEVGGPRRPWRRSAIFGVALLAVGILIAAADPIKNSPWLAVAVLCAVIASLYWSRLIAMPGRAQPAADPDRRWGEMAGEVSVGWALEHHDEITMAATLRHDGPPRSATSSALCELGNEATADLAHVIEARLTVLRDLGASGEAFPLVLDEPFERLDSPTTLTLLDLLSRSAGDPQIVVATNDPDAACWGRRNALAAGLAIVEPVPQGRAPSGRKNRTEDASA